MFERVDVVPEPHGWIFLVTNQGTMPLGNTAYGHALWPLAAPQAAA